MSDYQQVAARFPETLAYLARAEAKERLEGHKGVLGSLTDEQMRKIAAMDEPAVLCGRLPA